MYILFIKFSRRIWVSNACGIVGRNVPAYHVECIGTRPVCGVWGGLTLVSSPIRRFPVHPPLLLSMLKRMHYCVADWLPEPKENVKSTTLRCVHTHTHTLQVHKGVEDLESPLVCAAAQVRPFLVLHYLR